jgi:hypothetical protein
MALIAKQATLNFGIIISVWLLRNEIPVAAADLDEDELRTTAEAAIGLFESYRCATHAVFGTE